MARGRKTGLRFNISPEEQEELERWQRSPSIPAGQAKRARLILLLASGMSVTETARTVGIAYRLVYKWVHRFILEGIRGLSDRPRPGRPPVFSPRSGHAHSQTGVRAA